jgi:hypothetical protein
MRHRRRLPRAQDGCLHGLHILVAQPRLTPRQQHCRRHCTLNTGAPQQLTMPLMQWSSVWHFSGGPYAIPASAHHVKRCRIFKCELRLEESRLPILLTGASFAQLRQEMDGEASSHGHRPTPFSFFVGLQSAA